MQANVAQVLLVLLVLTIPASAFIEGLYCGTENCYDILGVTRDSEKGEISKAYRKLARKWHPDMHKTKKAKAEAAIEFQKIATAYEILKDEEQRKDYDYMLDNPDEYLMHYYAYYRRRVAPKVDVRIVIAVTITVISAVQYYLAWSNYNETINGILRDHKFRMRATDIAKSRGLLSKDKKKQRGKTKEELKEEDDEILKNIVLNDMGFHIPEASVYKVLWLNILFSPYYLVMYLKWYARWVWKFYIKKEEYGDEEKMYLIERNMKWHMNVGNNQWLAIPDFKKEEYMNLELWDKEKFQAYKNEQEEEMKAKLAESARYRRYRRYMKNEVSQMTFGPE